MRRTLWIVVLSLLLIVTFTSIVYIGYLSIQQDYLPAMEQFAINNWFKQQNTAVETKSISQTITYTNRLIIENIAGNISIVGENTNEITIIADVEVTSNDQERAMALLEQIDLLVQDQSSSSIMTIIPPLVDKETATVNLSLVVPQEIQGTINTRQGNIKITNLTGNLEVNTGQGHVELQIPEDTGYNITASYPSGSFHTELPLSGTQTDNFVEGVIGVTHQDNQLIINVESGSINIKYY
ncbi:MAG: DUF4097 domain-containing protein [Firmicutes bacterium]|nr:DUF4097 domain-containing protein [Bacillota bacterium]